MKYPVRRKDRQIPEEEALAIIDKAPFGVMATVDSDGEPYCVPLSLVRDGQWLYLHCAQSGHKTDNLKAGGRVCVTFVGDVSYPQDNFTTVYESAIVFGTAREVTADDEKTRCLEAICRRFTPANMDAFNEEISKALSHTGVWKIHIDEVTGKRRVLK